MIWLRIYRLFMHCNNFEQGLTCNAKYMSASGSITLENFKKITTE